MEHDSDEVLLQARVDELEALVLQATATYDLDPEEETSLIDGQGSPFLVNLPLEGTMDEPVILPSEILEHL